MSFCIKTLVLCSNKTSSFIIKLLWYILTLRESYLHRTKIALTRTYHWYQSYVTKTTNKKIIENLEAGLGRVQSGIQRMELDVANKLHHLEETITKLSDVLLSNKGSSSNNNHGRDGTPRSYREEEDCSRQFFLFKNSKIGISEVLWR